MTTARISLISLGATPYYHGITLDKPVPAEGFFDEYVIGSIPGGI